MMPPAQMAGTAPIRLAATPLSKAPISFEELIKIQLTAAILPRRCLGDIKRMMDLRMTTLTPSKAPENTSVIKERGNDFERPNMIMEAPKPATQKSRFFPAFSFGGL